MVKMKRYLRPAHTWQEWESFDPETDWDVPAFEDYTYQDEWHAVYTIQLGELVQSGVFDWTRPELDWSSAALDSEQYSRVCAYFIERFRYREISITPALEWFQMLKRKLVFELMPKYKPMYEVITEGINPLAKEDEYFKERKINSDYPETLLSENADYISDGYDVENERILVNTIGDGMQDYVAKYRYVDELLLDELESMFICMYTSYVNGF